MTQDEIIEMAKQVGLITDGNQSGFDDLEAFAKLVAAKEREACAKVCEEIAQESDSFTESILRATATQIRARGKA